MSPTSRGAFGCAGVAAVVIASRWLAPSTHDCGWLYVLMAMLGSTLSGAVVKLQAEIELLRDRLAALDATQAAGTGGRGQ